MKWKQRKQGADYLRSAQFLTRLIVANRDSLVESHYNEMLKICIWKLTEAEGSSKHNTRFRSTGAIQNPKGKLNHEHVVTSRDMRQRIMETPDLVDEIIAEAIGCTVLKSEHQELERVEKLDPNLRGWDRYRAAGIEVWDLLTGERVV